jgi:hypothetical protein
MISAGERLSKAQVKAIGVLAEEEGWDRRSTEQIRLLLWCLFHYYVRRLR